MKPATPQSTPRARSIRSQRSTSAALAGSLGLLISASGTALAQQSATPAATSPATFPNATIPNATAHFPAVPAHLPPATIYVAPHAAPGSAAIVPAGVKVAPMPVGRVPGVSSATKP